MLVIRSEQLAAFSRARVDDFRQRLVDHLAALPALRQNGWKQERIAAEVDEATRRAPEYHLKREIDVARLAEIFCTQLNGFSGVEVDMDGLNILYAYGVDPAIKLKDFETYLRMHGIGGK